MMKISPQDSTVMTLSEDQVEVIWLGSETKGVISGGDEAIVDPGSTTQIRSFSGGDEAISDPGNSKG